MTPERLAQIEEKLRDLKVVGNTPGAQAEREDFLNVEVPELVQALKDADRFRWHAEEGLREEHRKATVAQAAMRKAQLSAGVVDVTTPEQAAAGIRVQMAP